MAETDRRRAGRRTAGAPAWVAGLTGREADVLRLMAAGLTDAEIAGRLQVGPATAKTHVAAVLAKTGARDRTQAVIVAYEAGWSPRAEPPAGLRARPAT
ncbi:response regulator transcription factor [Streptomyces griseus]|uniref:LuxR-family transcriptional regulator n=1 Tax=Streptomyces griseus subsp. griseus (strain JCM 4626 / CBS 651.72 / NBRC 13350 / KCC S-0626 / ISP 5235) TaxID=455632 RepID=B1W1Q4_STRGG|nr:putative LuxR-family transcriptional regulator [Streptomyces griseus subsp. griseus NBRC 13350]